jgi:eukaryotic-like serine/threonine-protein kinase
VYCETWQEARKLMEVALERDPGEWHAFLQRACIDNQALGQEVGALLEAHLEAGDFLGGPALDSGGWISESPQQLLQGRRIGAYKVVRRVGKGGMGEVYLAVRADEEFEKRVALKLLKPGMDTEEVTRRFRTERQILAALDHPNIAKLLDGGTTPEGLPYIVMEYVEGKPIDEYCNDNGFSTRQRLELFCVVCSAVHSAHRNLVVHRDLKPNNILVTPEGTPKLLDFGVAKLLNPELSSTDLAPTATALRLMTPDYASPEQARGEPVTTAADVYSLGVLLYYLLTGHRPYRIESPSPVEVLRVICEQEPETPSTVVMQKEETAEPDGGATSASVGRARDGTPAKLRRRLIGDLDNIVLKALRKEPARRYGSAEHFAEDIRRHLEGRPVLARKNSLTYRAGKFVRRHRIGVAVAVTSMAACIGFGVVMATQRAQILEEKDRAEQAKTLLIELFEETDPLNAGQEPLSVRDFLDRGAQRLQKELATQPEARADLMEPIGVIYQRLGELDRAAPLLEEALALHRKALGRNHVEVATSLNLLADLRMELGEYDAAVDLFRQALEIRRQRLGEESVEAAESLNDLGKALQRQGRLDQAEACYRQALAMRRMLLGARHAEVAETINNLATVHFQKGDYVIAEQLHRDALAMREEVLGRDHIEVSESLNNLAVLLKERGAFDEARSLYERALKLRRKHLGEKHPRVATTLHNLAGVLLELGDLEAAEALYRQAIDTYVEKLGDRHLFVAGSLFGLASVKERRGETREAEALYLKSIEIFRERKALQHRILGLGLTGLAAVRESQGAFTSAEPLIYEALPILEQAYPAGHWRIAEAESILARCFTGLGRLEQAKPLLIRSYSILASTPGQTAAIRAQEALDHLTELH